MYDVKSRKVDTTTAAVDFAAHYNSTGFRTQTVILLYIHIILCRRLSNRIMGLRNIIRTERQPGHCSTTRYNDIMVITSLENVR